MQRYIYNLGYCYFVVLATCKRFHPVLAIQPVFFLSFSVVVIYCHFIMLADKFYNYNNYYYY